MRTIRPRGTGALTGAGRCPVAEAAPALGIRVPQAPQKANPVGTARPQLGQVVPSGASCPDRAAGAAPRAEGPGVSAPVGKGKGVGCCTATETIDETAACAPEVGRDAHVPAADELPPEEVVTGAGVGSSAVPAGTEPFACEGAGIFGESPQGIPPFGLTEEGNGVASVAIMPA